MKNVLYLALFTAAAWFASTIAVSGWVVWNAIHHPHVSLLSCIDLAGLAAATLMLALLIIVIPTFAATQALQGAAIFLFARANSAVHMSLLVASVVLLGTASFACYDYIVPSFSFFDNDGPGWTHGFTQARLTLFMGIQTFLCAFSWWRLGRSGLLRS